MPVTAFLTTALENTDVRMKNNKTVTPAFLMAVMLWFPLQQQANKIRIQQNLSPLEALEIAMDQVINEQNYVINIPKRFALVIREIWLLQYRFKKRMGTRPLLLLEHPRFRAAYDFLALRSIVGDEHTDLAEWWTRFQEVPIDTRQEMIAQITASYVKRRHNKKKSAS